MRMQLNLLRIKAVILKEVRLLSRDRLTFAMVVMLPLVQLVLFCYAINTNVRYVPVGIVDQSESALGRKIVEQAKSTQVINVIANYTTVEEAKKALTKGKVKGVFVLPFDLAQRVQQKRTLGQWLVDGSDSTVGNALMSLQNMPLPMDELSSPRPVVNFEMALFYNPQRASSINIAPGLVAVILTMTMTLFTSIALVRERERGNLELLITTPVKPFEIMLAQIIPYICFGFLQVGIILSVSHFVFNVPINGSLVQIGLGAFVFIAATLILGLLVSTFARTQLQAMQMSFFILLPSILLSGFMFPFEGMPKPAQWISEMLPATHFMRIIRGIMLRSATLLDLWEQVLYLVVFIVIGIAIASARFKKTLD